MAGFLDSVSPRFRPTTALACVLLALLVGCGDSDEGSQPDAADIPSGAVAIVGDVAIPEREVSEQVRTLRRAGQGSTRNAAATDELRQQALTALLQAAALEQEAERRGVEVSRAEVRRRWNEAARKQFPNRRALRRFLHGQTLAKALEQLRLQLLTARIDEQIAADAGGGKEGARAVEEFHREFQRHWQERTACRNGYTSAGCSADG